MSSAKKWSLKLAVLIAGLAVAGPALAKSSYMTSFETTYPAAVGSKIDSCTICHTSLSTYARNSYGSAYANAGHSYTAIASADSDGDGFTNAAEITALTFPGDAADKPAAAGDTTAPAVSAFTLPATASSLTVTISTLTATDAVGVTGYFLSETATKPAATATGWTTAKPTSFTFASAGAKTLYAFAKDAAGNVSNGASASVSITITVPDTTAPAVSAFTLPATASSLTVTISTLTATDAVGVTGYFLSETATKPAATATGWTTAKPTSYTFASAGAKTLYAFAKDAAGNVSNGASASVSITITVPDTTAPTVSAFTLPATASSLTVTISTLTATDAVGVTGYLLSETATKPAATAAGWLTAKPTSYTFASAGAKTLYAFAKDAAGNVSNGASAPVTITITVPDTTAPTVSAFTLPATASSLTVTISTLTATDAVGVTGYLLSETGTKPTANAAGWTTAKPTSYAFGSAGTKTLYAFAKDAAGNVSNGASASVTITITVSDTTAPTVSAFSLPATSTSLSVNILTLTASDAVGVTGYLLSETSTTPAATSAGWTTAKPTSYTFATEGAKTLYAFAKDAAGNVSAGLSSSVTITLAQAFCPATWLTLSPTTASLDSTSQQYTVSWTAIPGCESTAWTAATTDPWITISGAASGAGAGSLTYSVDANTGAARTGFITIGSSGAPRTHTVQQAAAVGSTLTSYVLWTRGESGQAVLWEVDASNVSGTMARGASRYVRSQTGVGRPWEATGFSQVSDTVAYVLWSRSDTGQAALWKIDPSTGALIGSNYLHSKSGVGASWKATSYTHVSDTEGYVLWTRSDTGRGVLWQIDPSSATGDSAVIKATSLASLSSTQGVGKPWEATSYSHVSATEGYVLWTRSDTGQGVLWRIDPSSAAGSPAVIKIGSLASLYSTQGVGAPWMASGYTHVSPTEGYVLWTRTDTGQAVVWQIDPSSAAGSPSIIQRQSMAHLYSKNGVGAQWKASKFVIAAPVQ